MATATAVSFRRPRADVVKAPIVARDVRCRVMRRSIVLPFELASNVSDGTIQHSRCPVKAC
jgi:hypothetical protein